MADRHLRVNIHPRSVSVVRQRERNRRSFPVRTRNVQEMFTREAQSQRPPNTRAPRRGGVSGCERFAVAVETTTAAKFFSSFKDLTPDMQSCARTRASAVSAGGGS